MPNNEPMTMQKERDLGSIISCSIAAAVWWFLSGEPSTFALACAGFFLVSLFSGFCILAVFLPGPDSEQPHDSFAPLPQFDAEKRKSLTY
jgi:hypothetical protein